MTFNLKTRTIDQSCILFKHMDYYDNVNYHDKYVDGEGKPILSASQVKKILNMQAEHETKAKSLGSDLHKMLENLMEFGEHFVYKAESRAGTKKWEEQFTILAGQHPEGNFSIHPNKEYDSMQPKLQALTHFKNRFDGKDAQSEAKLFIPHAELVKAKGIFGEALPHHAKLLDWLIESGSGMKAMFDLLDGDRIYDLKTTSNPHVGTIVKDIYKYGYDFSALWYSTALTIFYDNEDLHPLTLFFLSPSSSFEVEIDTGAEYMHNVVARLDRPWPLMVDRYKAIYTNEKPFTLMTDDQGIYKLGFGEEAIELELTNDDDEELL